MEGGIHGPSGQNGECLATDNEIHSAQTLDISVPLHVLQSIPFPAGENKSLIILTCHCFFSSRCLLARSSCPFFLQDLLRPVCLNSMQYNAISDTGHLLVLSIYCRNGMVMPETDHS